MLSVFHFGISRAVTEIEGCIAPVAVVEPLNISEYPLLGYFTSRGDQVGNLLARVDLNDGRHRLKIRHLCELRHFFRVQQDFEDLVSRIKAKH